MIEFLVHDLMRDARGVIVCGRCADTAFGVGDLFTSMWWEHVERDDTTREYVLLDAGCGWGVRLSVQEIGYYDHTVERLYPCHTAGLRLVGEGLELLERVDFETERKSFRWWSLRGRAAAEPGAAPDTSG